jgi:Family of unknown function (DUF5677)
MDELKSAYKKIFENLSSSKKTDLTEPLYINLVKCAFIRNVDFNLQINSKEYDSLYFYIPFLRGLTEDIIVLNYLNLVIDDIDKDDFLGYLMFKDVIESTAKQNEFFEKERDFQPIVTNSILREKYPPNIFEVKLPSLKSKYCWKNKFPSVFQMAEDGGLKEMYNYLYHATSRLVHFNPHLLMKLSWGECNSLDPKDLARGLYQISTSNFSGYYKIFCEFYGSYLFNKFIQIFDHFLEVEKELGCEVKNIRSIFSDNRRWPELITFEELNIDLKVGVSMYDLEKGGIERLMGRIMYKLFQDDDKNV